MAAGQITIDLLLKTGVFEENTKRASRELKKIQKDAEDMGRKLGLAFTGAALGLGYLVKSSIDSADHLNDLSKKTGIAADTLGGIGFAAQQSGGDLESVATAAGKLNKSLAEAAAGNKEASEAFNLLGISVKDAAGNTKFADVVMAELADKFASYADGPEKAALALRIFGKAGADIIPLLDEGGKSLQDNIAYFKRYSGVTVETARAADQFNDTLTKINLLSGAFGKTLTANLLPPLQGLADLFLENKEKGDQMKGVADDLAGVLKGLAFGGLAAAQGFLAFGKALGGTLAAADAARRFQFGDAFAIGRETLADIGVAKDRIDALYEAIYSGRKKTGDFDIIDFGKGDGWDAQKPAPRLSGGNGSAAAKAQKDDFDRLLKSVLEMDSAAKLLFDSEGKLTAAQEFGAKVAGDYAAGLLKITPAQLAVLDSTLKGVDAIQKAIEAREAEVRWINEATNANADFVDSLRRTRDAYQDQAKDVQGQIAAFGKTEAQLRALEVARLRDAAAAKLQKAAQADDAFLTDLADSYRDQAAAIDDLSQAQRSTWGNFSGMGAPHSVPSSMSTPTKRTTPPSRRRLSREAPSAASRTHSPPSCRPAKEAFTLSSTR